MSSGKAGMSGTIVSNSLKASSRDCAFLAGGKCFLLNEIICVQFPEIAHREFFRNPLLTLSKPLVNFLVYFALIFKGNQWRNNECHVKYSQGTSFSR